MSNTAGHSFKVRDKFKGDVHGKFLKKKILNTGSGKCLEHTARNSNRSRYVSGIQDAFRHKHVGNGGTGAMCRQRLAQFSIMFGTGIVGSKGMFLCCTVLCGTKQPS